MRRNPKVAELAAPEQTLAGFVVMREVAAANVQRALEAHGVDLAFGLQNLFERLDLERLVFQHERLAALQVALGELRRRDMLNARDVLAVHEFESQKEWPGDSNIGGSGLFC